MADTEVAVPLDPSNVPTTLVDATPAVKESYALETLKLINTARIQNGLRHNDYQRYRRYCNSRLYRLRKSLHFTQGNKARYVKRNIDPELISQGRFLLIPLTQAERAWAYAMELKDSIEPRARFHFNRRLKKATKYAAIFASLCSARGDNRTALEAEAYSLWLNGTFALENERWEDAMQKLLHARKIYEQIGKVGDQENRDICKHRLEELDPSITYCNYNLAKHGGQDTVADIHALIDLKSKGPGTDLLNSKLENVLADARKKQATTLTEVTWRGKVVPLKSEKLRVAFLSAQDTTYELEREENLETKLDLYDKLFICYNDALRIILEEIRADPSSASAPAQRSTKTEIHLQNLQVLQSYLTFLKLSRTVERNLQLVDSLTKRLKGQGVAAEETSVTQKASRPDELVRLFENLIQNMNDLEEVRPKEDVEQGKEIAANILTFKAFRCFYLGISYGDGNKVDEAIALFDRAAKHTAAAVDHHKACASPKRADLDKLDSLLAKIRMEKCLVQARSFLASLTSEQKQQLLSKSLSSLSISSTTPTNGTLIDNPDSFDPSFVGKPTRLVELPPEFEAIYCRPLLFDLALELEFPSLEKRKGQKIFTRLLSSLWGRS